MENIVFSLLAKRLKTNNLRDQKYFKKPKTLIMGAALAMGSLFSPQLFSQGTDCSNPHGIDVSETWNTCSALGKGHSVFF